MRLCVPQTLCAAALAITGLAAAATADSLDRQMEIVNDTGVTIVAFYGSHTDADSWEENIFGSNVLPAGQSAIVDFDDGTGHCVFDLRAVFDDGDVLEKFDVNVCEVGTFTYE